MVDCQASLDAFRLLREQVTRERERTARMLGILQRASQIIRADREVLLRSYSNFGTGTVDQLAQPILDAYDMVLADIDSVLFPPKD